MPVRGGDQSARGLEPPAALAAADEQRLVLEVLQRRSHRRLVRRDELRRGLLVGDREQHADRLRCRERQVERRHPRVAERVAQPPPRVPRIVAGEQRGQLRAADPARQAQRPRARAGPLARRLAAAGVVVIAAQCDGALVVALLAVHELADAQQAALTREGDTACPASEASWAGCLRAAWMLRTMVVEGAGLSSAARLAATWRCGVRVESTCGSSEACSGNVSNEIVPRLFPVGLSDTSEERPPKAAICRRFLRG